MAKSRAALRPAAAIHQRPIEKPAAYNVLFTTSVAEKAIDRFEKALGGRAAIVDELLTSPTLTPRIEHVLQIALDPRFDRHPLAWICERAGITPGEFFAAFKDATLSRAEIRILQMAAEQSIEIARQLLIDGVEHEIICRACRGKKIIRTRNKNGNSSRRTCTTCQGHGTVVVAADRTAQLKALELVGLIGKNGGINVNTTVTTDNSQRTLHVGESAGLVQLQQAVSGLLFQQPLDVRALPRTEIRPADPDQPIVVEVVEQDAP